MASSRAPQDSATTGMSTPSASLSVPKRHSPSPLGFSLPPPAAIAKSSSSSCRAPSHRSFLPSVPSSPQRRARHPRRRNHPPRALQRPQRHRLQPSATGKSTVDRRLQPLPEQSEPSFASTVSLRAFPLFFPSLSGTLAPRPMNPSSGSRLGSSPACFGHP